MTDFFQYHKDEFLTIIITGAGFTISLADINEVLQTGVLSVGFCGGLVALWKSILHVKQHYKK